MSEGRTLWDMLTGRNKPLPVSEEKSPNPLNMQIGDVLTISTIDYENLFFKVKEIYNWTRLIEDKEREITDYLLLANDEEFLLRFIPVENPDPIAKTTYNVCILKLFMACGAENEVEWNGIEESLADPEGKMVFHAGEEDQQDFYRINTLLPYECELNNDKYLMWDYYCNVMKDGLETTEFLYVHQNQNDMRYEFWLGEEIDLARIH